MVPYSLLTMAASAAPCDLSGPADAPFTVPVSSQRVQILVEIWPEGGPPGWAEEVLGVLEARGLPAVVVVPPQEPDPALLPLYERVREGPSDFAVVLPSELVPKTTQDSLKPLQQALKPLQRHTGRLHTAVADIGSRQSEGMLGRLGLRALLDVSAPPSALPRMAGTFEGQPRTRVVLPAGLYEDACGTEPAVGPFTTRAADRAALAIQRASRISGSPMATVALKGTFASPDDARVLGRWLDQVVLPGKVQVVTAEQARKQALIVFADPVPEQMTEVGGRLVAIESLQAAALALSEPMTVPRSLPGELNPTEAFFGFVLLLADQTEGPVIRLGAMRGPANHASTGLAGPTSLSRERVREAAVALAGALPVEVPAAFSVDGRLLTAAELLLAMAAAVRGEDPVSTRPIAVPEPNERGLGWGDSTLP
jgi:hypothetical protein